MQCGLRMHSKIICARGADLARNNWCHRMWKSDGDDDKIINVGYGECDENNLIITLSLTLDLERNNWCHLKWKSNGDGDADDIGCNDDFDDAIERESRPLPSGIRAFPLSWWGSASQLHTFSMHAFFAFWGWKIFVLKLWSIGMTDFPLSCTCQVQNWVPKNPLTEASCRTGFGWNFGFAQRAVLALCQIRQWTRARVTHDL